jgi:hypothetical protein
MHIEREITAAVFNRPPTLWGSDRHFLQDLAKYINPQITFEVTSSSKIVPKTEILTAYAFDVKHITVKNNFITGIDVVDRFGFSYQCQFFINNGRIDKLITKDPYYNQYPNRYKQEFQL